ncbi:Ig-like V-type domain-containing protein FAM187A [Rhinophrynus dorsalis]
MQGFEIVEKKDMYNPVLCPAMLVFDTAAFLSDMTFELPCQCRPSKIYPVVWYYNRRGNSKNTLVLTDVNSTLLVDTEKMHRGSDLLLRFRIIEFNLVVFHTDPTDSGIYMCGTANSRFFYGYDVDIQESKDLYVSFQDQKGQPQEDLVMKDFVAFTLFWPWTKCDRCGVKGEQRRLGLCYIHSAYLNPRYTLITKNLAPCGSGAGALNQVIMNVYDNLGTIKDHFSWWPKAPTQLHTHKLGEKLTISCPGARPEHAVAWDKDNKRLYLSKYLIGAKKSMRIYIDHGNNLHFSFVKDTDKGVYYCWFQGKRKAGFRLAVTKGSESYRRFKDPGTIFIIKVVCMSFIFPIVIFVFVHFIKCCCYLFKCRPYFS